jgi:hypothetical protein
LTYAERTLFSEALMDRSRGSIFASPVVLFVAAIAVAMALFAAIWIVAPAMWKFAAFLFASLSVVITICGLVSCILSGKPANITLLWIIIMILAPLLGPLIWFAWGRKNT